MKFDHLISSQIHGVFTVLRRIWHIIYEDSF